MKCLFLTGAKMKSGLIRAQTLTNALKNSFYNGKGIGL